MIFELKAKPNEPLLTERTTFSDAPCRLPVGPVAALGSEGGAVAFSTGRDAMYARAARTYAQTPATSISTASDAEKATGTLDTIQVALLTTEPTRPCQRRRRNEPGADRLSEHAQLKDKRSK